ncbi:hypothetical protein Aperf_G00000084264 [Anoplocephala perfoliata]
MLHGFESTGLPPYHDAYPHRSSSVKEAQTIKETGPKGSSCHSVHTSSCAYAGSRDHILLRVIFHRLRLILFIGCVLLICSVGLVLQSCFWNWSQTNDFAMNEEVDSVYGVSDHFEEADIETDSEAAHGCSGRPSRSSIELLEVRRLSMAMTRVANELRNAGCQRAISMRLAMLVTSHIRKSNDEFCPKGL